MKEIPNQVEVTDKGWWAADIGDYLKVIANGMVMFQPIISMAVKTNLSIEQLKVFASFYNFVKFTSPAFIFGIVFTVIRQSGNRKDLNLQVYCKDQWANNFVPTIIWTLVYLLIMPNLQQHCHYYNLASFFWQFITGNAAPHLWYSVMMLQFLIIMPIIKSVTVYVGNDLCRLGGTVIGIGIVYFSWLVFYDCFNFSGKGTSNWYLLDRCFLSFLIFGFYGGLAWNFHHQIQSLLFHYWWLVIGFYLLMYAWTRYIFISAHHLTDLLDDTYYRPSMAIYALAVIILIYLICIVQKVYRMQRCLKIIHYLAFYAYRAFLANVFWDRILWYTGGMRLTLKATPYLTVFITWLLTWLLSYLSVYLCHQLWLSLVKR